MLNYIKKKTFIRICCDSPLINWKLVDKLITISKKKKFDLITNSLDINYSKGMGVEIIKSELLKSYSITDFNLDKLFIGVTVLRGLELSTNIFFNFVDLEDVINCCIASSHIPFLTGGFINKYNNEISFDGGFSNSPYLDLNNTAIHINPNIWNTESKNNIIDYYDLIIARKESFSDLYDKGYYDTKLNRKRLRKKLFNNIKLK